MGGKSATCCCLHLQIISELKLPEGKCLNAAPQLLLCMVTVIHLSSHGTSVPGAAVVDTDGPCSAPAGSWESLVSRYTVIVKVLKSSFKCSV